MGISESAVRGLTGPVAVAFAITLGFFVLTGNWTNLGNPIASAVSLAAGLTGFAIGAAALTRHPKRKQAPIQTPS